MAEILSFLHPSLRGGCRVSQGPGHPGVVRNETGQVPAFKELSSGRRTGSAKQCISKEHHFKRR